MLARLLAALAFIAALPAPARGIEVGQLDDFESGVANWERGSTATPGPGGISDSYLEIGSDAKLVDFNSTQWSGDATAAGVEAIHLQAANLGTGTIFLRVAVGTGAPLDAFYASAQAVELEVGSGWVPVELSLDPADLVLVQGTRSVTEVLGDIVQFRILSNPVADFRGEDTNGRVLGIDDVLAVPEAPTGTGAMLSVALLGMRAGTRSGQPRQTPSSSASRSSIVCRRRISSGSRPD